MVVVTIALLLAKSRYGHVDLSLGKSEDLQSGLHTFTIPKPTDDQATV